jgi:hypothetical protein
MGSDNTIIRLVISDNLVGAINDQSCPQSSVSDHLAYIFLEGELWCLQAVAGSDNDHDGMPYRQSSSSLSSSSSLTAAAAAAGFAGGLRGGAPPNNWTSSSLSLLL